MGHRQLLRWEETYLASIAALDRRLVQLYAAHFAYSEICNGGLQQYLWNSTGAICPETIEGYPLIGMTELAFLIERASSFLGNPYPRDREARQLALFRATGCDESKLKSKEGFSMSYQVSDKEDAIVRWDQLNQEFHRLAETENGGFESAANRYAAIHKPSGSNN